MPNKAQPPGTEAHGSAAGRTTAATGTAGGRDLQKVIAALASPIRREILALIWDREVPSGQIAAAFDLTKPTISQHLAVLRNAGLVTARAAGTTRRYRARREALAGLHAALDSPGKWRNADDAPERALAGARTAYVVVASTDVATSQAATFAAFTDPAVYSRWLGVPVTIENGRFACTMEWGTHIRGRYELLCPPELIVMRWDFEDGTIPVPGGEMTGYLWIRRRAQGARVEVHQLADTPTQARFLESAWALVLGRLTAGVASAAGRHAVPPPRARRPKQRAHRAAGGTAAPRGAAHGPPPTGPA